MSFKTPIKGWNEKGQIIVRSPKKGTDWPVFVPDHIKEKLQPRPIGTEIEAEVEQPEGKRYWVLKSYREVGNGASSPSPAPQGNGVEKDKGMFVMGVVGRAMGSGQYTVNDIKLLALAAAEAWEAMARGESLDGPTGEPEQRDGAPVPDYDSDVPF